jgi:hypothetical protein
MANTFELIASSTVGSGGAANIDFTSIPATYTDLCLKFICATTRSALAEDFSFDITTFYGAIFSVRRCNGSMVRMLQLHIQ